MVSSDRRWTRLMLCYCWAQPLFDFCLDLPGDTPRGLTLAATFFAGAFFAEAFFTGAFFDGALDLTTLPFELERDRLLVTALDFLRFATDRGRPFTEADLEALLWRGALAFGPADRGRRPLTDRERPFAEADLEALLWRGALAFEPADRGRRPLTDRDLVIFLPFLVAGRALRLLDTGLPRPRDGCFFNTERERVRARSGLGTTLA